MPVERERRWMRRRAGRHGRTEPMSRVMLVQHYSKQGEMKRFSFLGPSTSLPLNQERVTNFGDIHGKRDGTRTTPIRSSMTTLFLFPASAAAVRCFLSRTANQKSSM